MPRKMRGCLQRGGLGTTALVEWADAPVVGRGAHPPWPILRETGGGEQLPRPAPDAQIERQRMRGERKANPSMDMMEQATALCIFVMWFARCAAWRN
jgi:hypothetical protein